MALFLLLPPVVMGAATLFEYSNSAPSGTTWQDFLNNYLEKGEVARLVVASKSEVHVFLRPDSKALPKLSPAQMASGVNPHLKFTISDYATFDRRLDEAQRAAGIDPRDFVPVAYNVQSPLTMDDYASLLPAMILVGFLGYFGYKTWKGGSGAMGSQMSRMLSISKAKINRFNKDSGPRVGFPDVAGLGEAKAEISEFVEFLRSPAKFTALGARIPKGALLTGPPGTGKTMLARATAGEAGVPFLSVSGSEFLELYGGVGPSRVRDLFQQAAKEAPCIVFIDEIDAVGRKRGGARVGGANDERENTLNQLLVEMDGFSGRSGVIVLAATNRADILDPALLRPGRFDRQVSIDLPDLVGRRDIFLVHLRGKLLEGAAVDVAARLATLTPGFSGADISNVCNEAALGAARRSAATISLSDGEAAIERVVGGLEKRSRVLSALERRTVAFHEAGHAVAGWFLEHSAPLLKVSIVPRGSSALGYAMYQPADQHLHSTEQIRHRMIVTLSGRSAERTFFGRITTGAADDLRKVTRMGYQAVVTYGMSKAAGLISFKLPEGGEVEGDKQYSNATAELFDREVRAMVSEATAASMELIAAHREAVEAVATRLLARDVLSREDLVELLGPRPWAEKTTFAELTAHHAGRAGGSGVQGGSEVQGGSSSSTSSTSSSSSE